MGINWNLKKRKKGKAEFTPRSNTDPINPRKDVATISGAGVQLALKAKGTRHFVDGATSRVPGAQKGKQVMGTGGTWVHNVAGDEDLLPAGTQPFLSADMPPSLDYQRQMNTKMLSSHERIENTQACKGLAGGSPSMRNACSEEFVASMARQHIDKRRHPGLRSTIATPAPAKRTSIDTGVKTRTDIGQATPRSHTGNTLLKQQSMANEISKSVPIDEKPANPPGAAPSRMSGLARGRPDSLGGVSASVSVPSALASAPPGRRITPQGCCTPVSMRSTCASSTSTPTSAFWLHRNGGKASPDRVR